MLLFLSLGPRTGGAHAGHNQTPEIDSRDRRRDGCVALRHARAAAGADAADRCADGYAESDLEGQAPRLAREETAYPIAKWEKNRHKIRAER
jgi:hypothetical protein